MSSWLCYADLQAFALENFRLNVQRLDSYSRATCFFLASYVSRSTVVNTKSHVVGGTELLPDDGDTTVTPALPLTACLFVCLSECRFGTVIAPFNLKSSWNKGGQWSVT